MKTVTTQLQHYLSNSVARVPGKIALICGAQRFSYQTIHKASNVLANALVKFGIKRGDRIVIGLGNVAETIIIFWAVIKVGAIAVIVNAELKEKNLVYILQDSGAAIFFASKVNKAFYEVLISLPQLKKIVTNEIHSVENFNDKLDSYYNFIKDFSAENYVSKSIDLDLAAIIYTSGSTGEAKGVMLTHRNMLSALESINSYLENTENDVIISVLPLSFDYGLYQMLMTFAVGATLVLEQDLLLPTSFLNKIEKMQATVVPGVPTLFSILAQHYKRKDYDFSSVRYVTNTGATLSRKHIASIKNIFPQAKIYSMYGLTECKRCTYLPPVDIDRKPDSVGIAIPNTEIWIVNDRNERLPPNQIGQLVIRGATVMSGYWNKPAATAEKLRAGALPNERLLYTGDYGSLDEEGYFYFYGRMDEMLKVRGMKVSPKEIEDIIITFPGITEVAVIGVNEDELESNLYAFVSHETTITLTEQTVLAWCREKLEKSKTPQHIRVMSSLPKSANGKIDKQALHAVIAKGK